MTQQIDWNSFKETISTFLGREAATIEPSANLYEDLGIDSLGLFSLGMVIIRTFGCRLPVAAVANIRTVGELFDVIVLYPRIN